MAEVIVRQWQQEWKVWRDRIQRRENVEISSKKQQYENCAGARRQVVRTAT